MKWLDALYDVAVYGLTALLAAVASGVWWLIRRVFTNQTQIEMLQRDMTHRDTQRQQDREAMESIRQDVKEARAAAKETHALIIKSLRFPLPPETK